MKSNEIIKELEGLLPEQVDYAALVASPVPSSYSQYFVWETPEPYIIQSAIEFIKQQEFDIAAANDRINKLEKEIDRLNAMLHNSF